MSFEIRLAAGDFIKKATRFYNLVASTVNDALESKGTREINLQHILFVTFVALIVLVIACFNFCPEIFVGHE